MFYRIIVTLNFADVNPCDDIFDKALDGLAASIIINLGQVNQESGFISLEKCFHDEQPLKPCEMVRHDETPMP